MGLIANIESVTSGAAPAAFADVPALNTGSIAIASTASILLLMASVPIEQPSGDRGAEFRFAVDGVREGPFPTIFADGVDLGNDLASLVWAITGLTGSHTFSIQWQRRTAAAVNLDTTRVRNLQVLEIP